MAGFGYMLRLKWPIAVLFIIVAVALAATNIVLLRQNRELANLAARHIRPPQLSPGAEVSSLAGFNLANKRVVFRYGQNLPPTLLFVFSPSCSVCDLNWRYWTEILRTVNRQSVRVVLADTGSPLTAAYTQGHGITAFPVLAQVDPNDVIEYAMSLTPQTILVSGNGIVERVWIGVLGDKGVGAVKRSLASVSRQGAG